MHPTTLAAIALGPLLLNALISMALPGLTALVTAQTAHPGLKAVVLLVLSAVNGVIVEWQGNPLFNWRIAVAGAGLSFLVAVGAHFGLWRPTQITPGIQRAVPAGLGRRGTVPEGAPRP
jgi:hypothetical protein